MSGPGGAEPRVRVREITRHADPRGVVFEPMGPLDLPRQKNVHVVLTEPGAVRGNHLHRRATEVLVVHGPSRVRYRENGELVDRDVPAGEVHAFTFPPGVPHAIVNTGEATSVLVAFRDTVHSPADPDTERVVLWPEPRVDPD